MSPEELELGAAAYESALRARDEEGRVKRTFRLIGRTLRIPAWAFGLLAVSAVLGNAAQWVERNDLKAAQVDNKEESDCRSRIIGYVEGLTIVSDIALGNGLLELVDRGAEFDAYVAAYKESIERLEAARPVRERATEVCQRDPEFTPSDIPRSP